MFKTSPGSDQAAHCFRCGVVLSLPEGTVGRGESCSNCNSDVHVCLNCRHYDQGSYNECREPQAERVVVKDRSNFCDYFAFGSRTAASPGAAKDEVLQKLDSLFKK